MLASAGRQGKREALTQKGHSADAASSMQSVASRISPYSRAIIQKPFTRTRHFAVQTVQQSGGEDKLLRKVSHRRVCVFPVVFILTLQVIIPEAS